MARTDPQFNFRIPADLLDKLRASQKVSGRSLTAELVYRLERSFDLETRTSLQGKMIELQDKRAASDEEMISMLAERLLKAMTEVAKNDDGSTATIGETIQRAKSIKAKKKR